MAIGREKKHSKEKNTIVFEEVLDKMFSYVGKTLEEVEKEGGRDQYFITKEQKDEWIHWGMYHISKRRNMPKEDALMEMEFIDANWGLKIKDI